MSRQKIEIATPSAEAPAGVQVGSGSKSFSLRGRRLGMAVGCIVVVLLAGGWLTYALVHKSSPQPPSAQQAKQKQIDTLRTQANTSAQKKDYSAAQSQLDTAVSTTSDRVQQAQIYLQKAAIALATPNVADALKYAMQAENALPSAQSADLLCQTYHLAANNIAARSYCGIAIMRLQQTNPNDSASLARYKYDLQQASS